LATEKIYKTLFLLTKTYPFGPGEQYLTREINYLSPHFKKIIIYPNDYYSEHLNHDKDLPSNIEILNLNPSLKTKSKNNVSDYWYLAKNTLSELIATDDKKNFFGNFKWNLMNFWTQYQLAKRFGAYLKKGHFTPGNSTFYSYWFHKSALLLSVLKDKKIIERFVSRAHSIDLYHQYWGVINKDSKVPSFKMFKLKQVDSIITISDHGLNFLKKHFPLHSHKLKNFYLGVLGNNKLPFSNQKEFLIVTCSHLDWTKRVDKLAEALTKVDYACKWVHFGGGSELELNKIKDISKKIPAKITIDLKGYVSNQEINDFYRTNPVDLFVNLSLVEGVPVSIMEALSYGIPVIATNVYGNPEAVIENKNGFLLNIDFTTEELTRKINFCISNRDQLKQMGEESYLLFQERFNADENYTAFANYLQTQ
jgi:colanic acid/amylovoran biosynthesis glycosyltransferase